MSTSAYIGVRYSDGSIMCRYTNYDGYPSHAARTVEEFIMVYGISEFENVIRAAVYEFRQFPEQYTFEKTKRRTSPIRHRQEFGMTDYAYLWDTRSGELVEYYCHGIHIVLCPIQPQEEPCIN